ncbi:MULTISPECIES: arginase [Thermoactinomyces]|uniref:Arginase n=1 Tax=Thermoactinomyces daqus TaxID=1329516 RepID=A0A7W1XCP5_9BACL|nr:MULTISPECIES: arginase [Thermoactinomyces]MBA4544117.1 arginase [Thermoactinomyces daqus]MBH8599503.1 arginase [Thermoactinomyces sp. CICC 10523]MBH8605423.1 arginase [Thermoactinomyces sp. CICC 10522]MBH8608984.1 arginase [Thermoactinomyces sp. CICC 10521]
MEKKPITIIGMPMDLGQGRRGVDMGPSAIRYASAQALLQKLGYEVEDLGDLHVPSPESKSAGDPKLKYLNEIRDVCEKLAETVSGVIARDRFPLVLGGDHSMAIGTIAGAAAQYENMGVIWYDAHGDLNTGETSPSGNIHGMSLAVSLGIGHPDLVNIGGFAPKVRPEHTVIIGARELDPGERDLIGQLGIKVFTMHEIDRLGMARVMEEAIGIVSNGTDGVHLSLDLDGLDPKDAPGVGTPVPGGVTYRESHLAMEMLAEAGIVTSAEFVEVNPILDRENQTAKVAVALMGSVFGQKVL